MARGLPPGVLVGGRVKLAQAAALSFEARAVEVLRELDRPTTRAELARIVGECGPAFSDALCGRRGTLDRVQRWIARWEAAGFPALELLATSKTVAVRRAPLSRAWRRFEVRIGDDGSAEIEPVEGRR